MKNKNRINYFPYKIFQKNSQNLNKKFLNVNSTEGGFKHKKFVIDISKNLKSVAISNKLFTSYMDNYNNLTQDYCFKSPDYESYPIRKNTRYLSAASIKKINALYKSGKKKKIIIKRPISANNNIRINIINADKHKHNNVNYFNESVNKRNDKNDLFLSLSDGMCYNNKIMLKLGNNNIDLDNDKKLKNEHFEYLKNYMNYIKNLNEYFNKTKLSHKNVISKGNVQYELNIYSICLKFKLFNNNNNDKTVKHKYQKLYISFKYLPIFYLLNYEIFKAFLSEIIYYDTISNNFAINKTTLDEIYIKYFNYINNNINDIKYINDITFYKNEFTFPPFYKWFVYNKDTDINNSNNNDNNNKTMIFDLKIELPKIKFKIIDYEITIKNNLKKSLIIQLIKTNFVKWEETILFELFFIKKFRYIINSILIHNNKFYKQKISLISNNDYKNKVINLNHNFEFYITEINDNYSNYYIFNPYVITLNRRKNNYHQEINLTLKESKILYKFGKHWGIMNTLLKCINFNNEINNKVNFRFDILDNISFDYFKENVNKNKEKKEQMKFKFNKIDITVSECSLKKLIIKNDFKKYEKFFKIPPNFLKLILTNKEKNFFDENKIKEYCKEINEEKEIEIKKVFSSKKINDLDLDELLIEKKPTFKVNKTNNNILNSKEVKSNKKIKKEVINSENKSNNKNKRNNSNLFLTKDFSKSNEEDMKNDSRNIAINSTQYHFRTAIKNNTLQLIRNKRELEKNRTIRENNDILNNGISISKLKNTILNLKQKRTYTLKK